MKYFLTSELGSPIIMIMKEWTPEEIREFRKRLNIYQKDLATMLGVTKRYVIYLEQGVKKPSMMLKLFMDCLEEKTREKGR
jgi:DNA-binding transcriptional regulator YiaG